MEVIRKEKKVIINEVNVHLKLKQDFIRNKDMLGKVTEPSHWMGFHSTNNKISVTN